MIFDHGERRAYHAVTGVDIHLTPRERSALAGLMQKPGASLRKEALTNLLYSMESDVQLSAVEVYVSRLRTKLEKAGAGVSIKSIRGYGYRLEAEEARV